MKFTGQVIPGVSIGTKFGIATANLKIIGRANLKHGVYFVQVFLGGKHFNAVLHYGERQTFGGNFSVEVHILDFDKQIYNEIMEIDTLKFDRPTKTFQNADALFSQVEKDILRARKFFLRQEINKKWQTVSPEQKEAWATTAIEKILHLPKFKTASHVLIYAPINNEINFVEKLCKTFPEKKYYFPLIRNDEMKFYASTYEKLKPGKFNIPEPNTQSKYDLSEINIAFIPAVAADNENNRLGQGMGFYDRVLSSIKTLKVIVLPKFSIVKETPREDHDEKVDIVIRV